MDTFRDVIEAFGGYAAFAREAGVAPGTASSLRSRDSLPAEYWEQTVAAAGRLGLHGITLPDLARIARTVGARKAAEKAERDKARPSEAA